MTSVEKMPNEMWRETSMPRNPKTAVAMSPTSPMPTAESSA